MHEGITREVNSCPMKLRISIAVSRPADSLPHSDGYSFRFLAGNVQLFEHVKFGNFVIFGSCQCRNYKKRSLV